jgi:hypothetical protein
MLHDGAVDFVLHAELLNFAALKQLIAIVHIKPVVSRLSAVFKDRSDCVQIVVSV